jgi:hypothetical protein
VQQDRHVGLLGSEIVRKDLGLEGETNATVKKLVDEWSEERHQFFKESPRLAEEERRRKEAAAAEKHDRALSELLTPAQRKRLGQIALQSQGLFAFKDREIAHALELSLEQREAIREIEHRTFFSLVRKEPPEERREPPPGSPPFPTLILKGISMLFDWKGRPPPPPFSTAIYEAVPKVLAVLDEQQLKKWNEMTGPPLEGIDELLPRMMGGPRPPGGPRPIRELRVFPNPAPPRSE